VTRHAFRAPRRSSRAIIDKRVSIFQSTLARLDPIVPIERFFPPPVRRRDATRRETVSCPSRANFDRRVGPVSELRIEDSRAITYARATETELYLEKRPGAEKSSDARCIVASTDTYNYAGKFPS